MLRTGGLLRVSVAGSGLPMAIRQSRCLRLLLPVVLRSPIAEGDQIVLALQTARFLVRSSQAAAAGKPVSGLAGYLLGEW